MITFTSAQLEALIAAFIFPASRVLALIATAPLVNSTTVPRRIRLLMGLAITIALVPGLPPLPVVNPATWQGLWIVVQQMLIGIGMGFTLRMLYSAVDLAGEYIGAQMGLGFATFYDPVNASQTPVLSEFISLLGLLIFLSMNGHLMFVAALDQSFHTLPIGVGAPSPNHWLDLIKQGSAMFATALFLALPIIVALLITNIALAVLTKAAPQLNLFSLGFPITLGGGFIVIAISLDYLSEPMQRLFEEGLTAMVSFAGAAP